jgi:hypothetical protein
MTGAAVTEARWFCELHDFIADRPGNADALVDALIESGMNPVAAENMMRALLHFSITAIRRRRT